VPAAATATRDITVHEVSLRELNTFLAAQSQKGLGVDRRSSPASTSPACDRKSLPANRAHRATIARVRAGSLVITRVDTHAAAGGHRIRIIDGHTLTM
jgi:hypothetical protein